MSLYARMRGTCIVLHSFAPYCNNLDEIEFLQNHLPLPTNRGWFSPLACIYHCSEVLHIILLLSIHYLHWHMLLPTHLQKACKLTNLFCHPEQMLSPLLP